MLKWVKKLVNKSNNYSSGLNNKGLQSDLNALYIVYDKVINDKRFGTWEDYLESDEIKRIISDSMKLTSNHPELLLHLGKLNESVFQLKMATTVLLDTYDSKGNLAEDVYKQQKNDAKDVINKLVQRVAGVNKTFSGTHRDDNLATLSFLKKQVGATNDQDEDLYKQVKKATNDPEYERKLEARIEEAYANAIFNGEDVKYQADMYEIPLPNLMTSDGAQQYLSRKSSGPYFASRKMDIVCSEFTELELNTQVPKAYRQFARKVKE